MAKRGIRMSPMPMVLLAVFVAGLFFYSYTEGMTVPPATPAPMAEPTSKDKKNTPAPHTGTNNAATTAAPSPTTMPNFEKPPAGRAVEI